MQAIARYQLKPGWRVTNVDECLTAWHWCWARIETLNPKIESQVNEPQPITPPQKKPKQNEGVTMTQWKSSCLMTKRYRVRNQVDAL